MRAGLHPLRGVDVRCLENTANALGPFLGGIAIREGLGWTSTGPVGAALALLGFLIWIFAYRDAGSAPAMAASIERAASAGVHRPRDTTGTESPGYEAPLRIGHLKP